MTDGIKINILRQLPLRATENHETPWSLEPVLRIRTGKKSQVFIS
jgi:hypothetical protein